MPRWSPSPSPDGQECYEAENSAPSGELSTWLGLNHDHSRPLDRLTFPFEGQGVGKGSGEGVLVERRGMAVLVLSALRGMPTAQEGAGQAGTPGDSKWDRDFQTCVERE